MSPRGRIAVLFAVAVTTAPTAARRLVRHGPQGRSRRVGRLESERLPRTMGALAADGQTDALAGWAAEGLSGGLAHGRDVPIMIELQPHGFEVGCGKDF